MSILNGERGPKCPKCGRTAIQVKRREEFNVTCCYRCLRDLKKGRKIMRLR
jgi:hypothetical protein